jgi:short-subunit dehydrogenase
MTLLINNAGVGKPGGFLAEESVRFTRDQFETNFFGPLQLTKTFASTLAANGGGAVLNVLSIASWISSPQLAIYSASKAAAWALTNGRHELHGQGTQVLGVHVGFVDTDLTRGLDIPKTAPDVVVARTFDALEAGAEEVLADEKARRVKTGPTADPSIYLVSAAF